MKKLLLSTFIGLNALFACAEKSENAFKKSETTFLAKTTTSKDTLRMLIFADTDDRKIGGSINKTLRYYKELGGIIQSRTNLVLKAYIYDGNKFKKDTLEKAVETLRANSNDVLWFIYLGHGFRYANQPNQIEEPQLFMGMPNEVPTPANSMDSKTIKDQLINKNNRLVLINIESCNTKIEQRATDIALSWGSSAILENVSIGDNYVKMFEQAEGYIIHLGSKPKQKAFYDDEMGGVVSLYFEKHLNHILGCQEDKTAAWLWQKVLQCTHCSTKKSMEERLPKDNPKDVRDGYNTQETLFYGIIDGVEIKNEDTCGEGMQESDQSGELRAACQEGDYQKAKKLVGSAEVTFTDEEGNFIDKVSFDNYWNDGSIDKGYLPSKISNNGKLLIVSKTAPKSSRNNNENNPCDCN